MSKIKVAFLFGGRSSEHEVSVVTALQAYEHLDKEKYEVIPVYFSKAGDMYTNPKFLDIKNYQDINSLLLSSAKVYFGNRQTQGGFITQGLLNKFIPIDIAFNLFHGPFGEDGSIQGVLEIYRIPYTGLNVTASAVCFDKVMTKHLFQSLGIPTSQFAAVTRIDWINSPEECLNHLEKELEFPMFVKPATGGSTIGANLAKDEDSLQFALDVAFTYSEKVIVEKAFVSLKEVNCAVLGYEKVRVSVCEMPVSSGDLLSYEDKYLKGGKGSKGAGMASLTRIIPAPISDKLTKAIQETTVKVFKALDGCGVARIDYFVDADNDKYWINEVNSPPGSLAFYLWEKTGEGLKYKDQLDIMISDGLKRTANQEKTQYTFDTPLLSQMAARIEDR